VILEQPRKKYKEEFGQANMQEHLPESANTDEKFFLKK
jgi:hypothetical protein